MKTQYLSNATNHLLVGHTWKQIFNWLDCSTSSHCQPTEPKLIILLFDHTVDVVILDILTLLSRCHSQERISSVAVDLSARNHTTPCPLTQFSAYILYSSPYQNMCQNQNFTIWVRLSPKTLKLRSQFIKFYANPSIFALVCTER